MSSLTYICDYGSSDESEQEEKLAPKKTKFPAPDLSKVQLLHSYEHIDDPSLHKGRERLFPHVRGNWATFVYISDLDVSDLVNKIHSAVYLLDSSCHICDNFHISLSQTFVLNYHQITPFITSLKKGLEGIERFVLSFDTVKVFCNENKSRTFVALGVDFFGGKYLKKIVGNIDQILLEYKLPIFYEDPHFHMSLVWLNGDKRKEIEDIKKDLNKLIVNFSAERQQNFDIPKISCKTGNKTFQFSLV